MPDKSTNGSDAAAKSTSKPRGNSKTRSAIAAKASKVSEANVVETLDRRALLGALRAFKRGEFDVRLPDSLDGIDGQICAVFKRIPAALQEPEIGDRYERSNRRSVAAKDAPAASQSRTRC